MRVRLTVGLAGVLGASVALLALSGCTVKEADEGAAGGGGSAGSSAGTGGSVSGGSAGSTSGGSAGSTSGGSAGSTSGGSAGSTTGDVCAGISTQGKCDGNKVILCEQPPPGTKGEPRVVTNDCGANYTCTEDATGAFCKLKTACVPGETRCATGGAAVEVCKADGSGFTATACAAKESCTAVPGKAASCEAEPQAGGTGAADTLKGCISFERKGLTTTGPTAIAVEPAVLQFVAVYNGNDYIGYGITGAADGCFEAELTAPATADTTVYVFAMDFDPETNQPLVAVAHYPGDTASGGLPKSSTEYWNWSNKQDGCGEGLKAAVVPNKEGPGKHVLGTVDHDGDTVPDMLIPEVCGSGAVRIFQWTRFGMVRLGKDHYGLDSFANGGKQRDVVTATEQLKQDSIAVYWEKGVDVACGACFSNKGNGPFHVDPAGEIDDLYDTAIYISGSTESPTHWSYSVLSHELGHWVMSNYSQSPGEGGVHYVGQESKPGLAYSEGWATAFGQWNSSFAGDWDPVYIDVQDGTTFHVDIEKGTYSGGSLVRPKANEPIDQFINENVVAGMIFKLNADGAGATKNISGGQGLGPDALFKAFISPRVKSTSLGRGYARVDLVDFFDGGRCTESLPNANITAVSNEVTFPWDSTPKCN